MVTCQPSAQEGDGVCGAVDGGRCDEIDDHDLHQTFSHLCVPLSVHVAVECGRGCAKVRTKLAVQDEKEGTSLPCHRQYVGSNSDIHTPAPSADHAADQIESRHLTRQPRATHSGRGAARHRVIYRKQRFSHIEELRKEDLRVAALWRYYIKYC